MFTTIVCISVEQLNNLTFCFEPDFEEDFKNYVILFIDLRK